MIKRTHLFMHAHEVHVMNLFKIVKFSLIYTEKRTKPASQMAIACTAASRCVSEQQSATWVSPTNTELPRARGRIATLSTCANITLKIETNIRKIESYLINKNMVIMLFLEKMLMDCWCSNCFLVL